MPFRKESAPRPTAGGERVTGAGVSGQAGRRWKGGHRALILGGNRPRAVVVTTCRSVDGAPRFDCDSLVVDSHGRRFLAWTALLTPWRRNQHGEVVAQRALVVGVRERGCPLFASGGHAVRIGEDFAPGAFDHLVRDAGSRAVPTPEDGDGPIDLSLKIDVPAGGPADRQPTLPEARDVLTLSALPDDLLRLGVAWAREAVMLSGPGPDEPVPGDVVVEVTKLGGPDPDAIGVLVNHGLAPYDERCGQCGLAFDAEVAARMSEEASQPCPSCGSEVSLREVWDVQPLSGRSQPGREHFRWDNAEFARVPDRVVVSLPDLMRREPPRSAIALWRPDDQHPWREWESDKSEEVTGEMRTFVPLDAVAADSGRSS